MTEGSDSTEQHYSHALYETLTTKQKEAWELREQGIKTMEAAKLLGINHKTYYDHIKACLRKLGLDDGVPMSEDSARFMEDWGPDDCIKELLLMANMEPDRIVTRNFFRVNSSISESTWNRYFGTFEEFKRQAGIKLSRPQHALERDIAKHASVDHYRSINGDRLDWAETYVRENGKRFKTIICCSDLHDIEIDRFYLRVLIDTIERVQPDVVSYVGDVFDLPEFSRYDVDPREWDVVGRMNFVHHQIFGPAREASPDSQFDLIEGNHEARMLKHFADASPALKAVLSDLHGMTISSLLGLEKYEINYIAKADLGTFTKTDLKKEITHNYKIYWNAFLAHHFPHGKNMSMPGVNGHHHKHIVWSEYNPQFGSYEWHQMGAGHKRDASFCEGEKWNNGFAICNVDTITKATAFDYIFVGESHAVSGGKWYYRQEGE